MARKPRGGLKGVGRRGLDGALLYFEMRCGDVKLYSSQIKTVEEGALAYDIGLRHMEGFVGGRVPDEKLNYPEYSRLLLLDPLPSDCDLQNNKKKGLAIILNQARAAAVNLPENLRRSTTAVGDPSPSNRSSSHQNVRRNSPYVSGGKQGLPNVKYLKTFSEIDKHIHECQELLSLKVEERQELEGMVAGIEEGSGVILPVPGPEMFHQHMDRIPDLLEEAEHEYKSEASMCSNLRKILEDHNSKAIVASLASSETRLVGRQRSSENERFPHVPEPYSPEEQDDFGVPVGVSETCGPPASFPAIVTPGGIHTTLAPVQMDTSQPVGLLESEIFAGGPPDHTEYPEEDIAEMLRFYLLPTNAGSPDWSHNIFEMGQGEFRIEDP